MRTGDWGLRLSAGIFQQQERERERERDGTGWSVSTVPYESAVEKDQRRGHRFGLEYGPLRLKRLIGGQWALQAGQDLRRCADCSQDGGFLQKKTKYISIYRINISMDIDPSCPWCRSIDCTAPAFVCRLSAVPVALLCAGTISDHKKRLLISLRQTLCIHNKGWRDQKGMTAAAAALLLVGHSESSCSFLALQAITRRMLASNSSWLGLSLSPLRSGAVTPVVRLLCWVAGRP